MSNERIPCSHLDTWLGGWPDRLDTRDNTFIARLAGEIAALDALGYDEREIRAALAGRLYVRAWAACPRWLEWIDALPRGAKWKDGVTCRKAGTGPVRALIVGDALLMSYRYCQPVGTKWSAKGALVIHDFRARTLPELIEGLPNGEEIEWALEKLARDNELKLTNNPHVLRNMGTGWRR